AGFLQLIKNYGRVDQWLQDKDHAFKTLQTTLSATPDPDAEERSTQSEVRLDVDDGPSVDPRTIAKEIAVDKVARARVGIGRMTGGAQQPSPEPQQTPANQRSGGTTWTPDLIMHFIKELITGFLAVVIIIITLILIWRTFSYVGETNRFNGARDLLTIVLGLAGAVVGYYFGRVPAEARATQATGRADEAVRQNAEIKAKTRSAADR